MRVTVSSLRTIVDDLGIGGHKSDSVILYRINPSDSTKVDAFSVWQTSPAPFIFSGVLRTDLTNNLLVSESAFLAEFPDAVKLEEL